MRQGGFVRTERDAEIVSWIGRVGAAGAEHVMQRFGMSRTRSYARLNRLVTDGLLDAHALLHGKPALYTATAEGLRWVGMQRLGAFRLSAGGFEHQRQVASAAVALERAPQGWQLMVEREFRVVEAEHSRLLASVAVAELPGGNQAVHRPDLALASADGRVLAVEVELTIKARRRLEVICRGYARARHVHHTYYLAAPAAGRAVSRAVERERAEDRITVLPLEQSGVVLELGCGEVSRAGAR